MLERIYGELRLAGIHAGQRDSQTPFVSTRSMMSLSGAAQRIQGVLGAHGLVLGVPQVVVRESKDTVRATFPLYATQDETRHIGDVLVVGHIDPVTKGTIQYRVDLNFAPHFLF